MDDDKVTRSHKIRATYHVISSVVVLKGNVVPGRNSRVVFIKLEAKRFGGFRSDSLGGNREQLSGSQVATERSGRGKGGGLAQKLQTQDGFGELHGWKYDY